MNIKPEVVIGLRDEVVSFTTGYAIERRFQPVRINIQGLSIDEVAQEMLERRGIAEGIVAARYIAEVNSGDNVADSGIADAIFPRLQQYHADIGIDVKVVFVAGAQSIVDNAVAKGYPCMNKSKLDANFLRTW